ncbi:unnamed protein product [Protopolystoma xenopodis]|uniref:Uncharacterized protein n=1 Tax=Protopolystoma xenopodis TaxID=117903 RepID=A0A448WAU7_9PLAT|nr:unnamed protein product [Protopolystoma xenopodis]
MEITRTIEELSLVGSQSSMLIESLGGEEVGLASLLAALGGSDDGLKTLISLFGNENAGIEGLIKAIGGGDVGLTRLLNTLGASNADGSGKPSASDGLKRLLAAVGGDSDPSSAFSALLQSLGGGKKGIETILRAIGGDNGSEEGLTSLINAAGGGAKGLSSILQSIQQDRDLRLLSIPFNLLIASVDGLELLISAAGGGKDGLASILRAAGGGETGLKHLMEAVNSLGSGGNMDGSLSSSQATANLARILDALGGDGDREKGMALLFAAILDSGTAGIDGKEEANGVGGGDALRILMQTIGGQKDALAMLISVVGSKDGDGGVKGLETLLRAAGGGIDTLNSLLESMGGGAEGLELLLNALGTDITDDMEVLGRILEASGLDSKIIEKLKEDPSKFHGEFN